MALVRGFVAAALAAYPAGLQKHQRQREPRVQPAMTVTATHRVLQQ